MKPEPLVREEILRSIPRLSAIYFDFDVANLRAEARGILVENAQWIKAHPEVKVQVAGHCDQRGTIEYNLALGQRRAKAVRDYYMQLGITGDRIATISYGKEKLHCLEDTEECWQANRRAETLEAAPFTENQP